MLEMGITGRLDEAISAPPAIKHVLIGQAVLNQSVSVPDNACCSCLFILHEAFIFITTLYASMDAHPLKHLHSASS